MCCPRSAGSTSLTTAPSSPPSSFYSLLCGSPQRRFKLLSSGPALAGARLGEVGGIPRDSARSRSSAKEKSGASKQAQRVLTGALGTQRCWQEPAAFGSAVEAASLFSLFLPLGEVVLGECHIDSTPCPTDRRTLREVQRCSSPVRGSPEHFQSESTCAHSGHMDHMDNRRGCYLRSFKGSSRQGAGRPVNGRDFTAKALAARVELGKCGVPQRSTEHGSTKKDLIGATAQLLPAWDTGHGTLNSAWLKLQALCILLAAVHTANMQSS